MSQSTAAPLHTPLPPLTDELLRRTACTGMILSDSRRFRRNNANAGCLLETQSTYAGSGHQTGSQDVWLRDMSRGGIRFIHAAQLFPGEHGTLTLPNDSRLSVEVIWCRRISPEAFVSGCSFSKPHD